MAKITLKNTVKIVDDKYVIKRNKLKGNNIFDYLTSRSFDYFPKVIKQDDNYIYYEYLDDLSEPKEQKISDLIILISLLHSKTTIYKEVDIDYYKAIYEEISKEITDTYNYYNQLMDNIDNEVYLSPTDYLIARNISKIYQNLKYAKDNIDNWYKLIENKREIRLVTIHNNLKLEHYLKNDKSYLISWDNSKQDMPIYDLISIYKNNYLEFDFHELFKIYLNKYPLTKEEMTLFLSLIAIPDKVKIAHTEYKKVLNARRVVDYLYKTDEILKEYRIKQETDKS